MIRCVLAITLWTIILRLLCIHYCDVTRRARKRANSIKLNKQRMLKAVHLVQRVWRNRSANWRWHIKHIKAKQAAEHVCVVIEPYAIITVLTMFSDKGLKC
jgi:hypothetical protein